MTTVAVEPPARFGCSILALAVGLVVVAAASLVGVAFGPGGELVVTSNETAYRFD